MFYKKDKNIDLLNSDLKAFGFGKKKVYLFKKRFGLNLKTRLFGIKKITLLKFKAFLKNRPKLFLSRDYEKSRVLFLINLKSYKGVRHRLKYPVRGQRTHTNGKTRKKIYI